EIGCVRRFRLVDGGILREQLLRLSDREHSFSYCILEAPIPLIDYVATVRLKPVTDGQATFWDWQASFGTPPGEEESLAGLVGEQIYQPRFAAVTAAFGHARPQPAPTLASSGTPFA